MLLIGGGMNRVEANGYIDLRRAYRGSLVEKQCGCSAFDRICKIPEKVWPQASVGSGIIDPVYEALYPIVGGHFNEYIAGKALVG